MILAALGGSASASARPQRPGARFAGSAHPARPVQDPTGGAYRWFACPNYFGEIVEWFGWALATLVAGGLAFAVYTTANLTPCALDHHCWHRKHFPDCPPSRRALVPFII